MKSLWRRRIEQSAVLLALGLGRALARRMSLPALWRLADLLARIAGVLYPRRRKLAEENLAASFPELSADERRRILRASGSNMFRTVLEAAKLPALSPEDLDALIERPGATAIREAYQSGCGLIFISAHLGNWEFAAAQLCHHVGPAAVVARDAGEDRKSAIINAGRVKHGLRVLGRANVLEMVRTLKSGGILAIMPDQHAAEGGIVMDFLGRPASVFTGPALLAQRTGARVFAGYCGRLPGGRLRLELFPEIEMLRTADRDADLIENTRRIHHAIEQMIRSNPGNWLWSHRRWKVPAGAAPAPEAGASSASP